MVALLRVDARLREAVPDREARFAERVVVAPRLELRQGLWDPETLVNLGARPFVALVLSGLVTHELAFGGRHSANLLGPGDLFRPWRDGSDTCLPYVARWTAADDTAIAVLDEGFLTAARRWPGLSTVIFARLAEQLEEAALRAAIVALPRIESRVLALFWQLADRWGVVTPDGIVVRLALTHTLIGEFVGAQRPTVSLALRALAAAGQLRRETPDTWVLSAASREALGADGAGRSDAGSALSPTSFETPAGRDRL